VGVVSPISSRCSSSSAQGTHAFVEGLQSGKAFRVGETIAKLLLAVWRRWRDLFWWVEPLQLGFVLDDCQSGLDVSLINGLGVQAPPLSQVAAAKLFP
jgi:hypothetical protein